MLAWDLSLDFEIFSTSTHSTLFNSLVNANYLASPPLVIAFAIFGNININFYKEPLGIDKSNKKIFLNDIWPKQQEIDLVLNKVLSPTIFNKSF